MSERPNIAVGKAGAIVPQNFDECYRMAQMMAASGMVPDAFRGKPEACMVAIMQGLEVGLGPMAALQSIAVINGRPSLWGDGAIAVVRASGLLEYMSEDVVNGTATCTVKRKGEPDAVVRKFTTDDAKRAGLLNKKGPWQQYTSRMLQMRARAFALRDVFPDALRGLAIAEEAQDIVDITPRDDEPKRISSYAAKKDGTDKRFNEIMRTLREMDDAEDVRELRRGEHHDYAGEWAKMPKRWKQLLDDEAALILSDLGMSQADIATMLDLPFQEAAE